MNTQKKISSNHKRKKYDARHGGPYDRGRADAWYLRECVPHYYKGGTHTSELVEKADMTEDEIKAYTAGFDEGMEWGEHKDWG
jgi:hypothetical protein